MGTLRFDLEVTLPRATAFDLLDCHYRELGYRVEESDRMNFRLVMDRGWLLGALWGDRCEDAASGSAPPCRKSTPQRA